MSASQTGQASDTRHHLSKVPVVVMMPHSRCNCRCVMCDIWKANRVGASLSPEILRSVAADLRALRTEEVVLSGGEALMHPNLWAFCAVLKDLPVRITLLSTGLSLARHAQSVAQWCDQVIVSLDGEGGVHDEIRGIQGAYAALSEGVRELKIARPGIAVSGRCVVQRRNFRHLADIARVARAIGLDHISFLAADISSAAFNRPDGWTDEHVDDVCLDPGEAVEFADILEEFIESYRDDSSFIAETPDKLRRLAQHYQAIHGLRDFPPVRCAAPWISAVIEADGSVRPCYFHPPLGNIHDDSLSAVLNSQRAVDFRGTLDISRNETCRKCVCTLTRTRDNPVSDGAALLAQRI